MDDIEATSTAPSTNTKLQEANVAEAKADSPADTSTKKSDGQRLTDLESRAVKIEALFDKLERRTYSIIVGVLVVIAVALIAVAYDYLSNNNQRYEKMLDVTRNFYTKEEVDSNISAATVETKQQLKSFKDCLSAGSWAGCLK